VVERVAGHTVIRARDESRDRPVLIDLWYPAAQGALEADHDYGLGRGRVAEGAPALASACPAIVLSHGAFGAANNYSWIAEHLARQGFVVAGVSHFRESYAYGPETIDPASATRPWLRTSDCSFALDHLERHEEFGRRVDRGRIGALGHSSGGATVIALGGAVYDPDAMEGYCASDAARLDRGCDYARSAPPLSSAGDEARRSYRDGRIRAIVALDPALGPGYSAESLAAVAVPVHVAGAVDNDFLPFASHAGHYAAAIPGASLTALTGGEGHFIYLDACNLDREANGVPLCRDRPGVDRAEVHASLAGVITDFFDTHLARP
jgi:predicted dienelactone hydrolase